jgi:hypothetical protein
MKISQLATIKVDLTTLKQGYIITTPFLVIIPFLKMIIKILGMLFLEIKEFLQ